jgi:methyl-accepting chemotaxis protein
MKKGIKFYSIKQISTRTINNLTILLSKTLDEQFSSLEMLANQDSIKDPSIPLDEKLKVIRVESKRTGDIDMNIADQDGNYLGPDGKIYSMKDAPSFQKAIGGERFVDDPVEDMLHPGTAVITYFVPIKHEGQVIGVLFRVKDAASLIDITKQLSFGRDGQAFMINGSGVNIANQDINVVLAKQNPIEMAADNPEMQSLADYQKTVIQEKSGVSTFTFGDKKIYAGFAPVEGTNWFLNVSQPQAEILTGLNQLKTSSLWIGALLLLLGAVLVYSLLSRITKPIIQVAGHLTTISEGDFTSDIPQRLVSRKDEIGTLAKAAHTISINLRALLRKVTDTAGEVAAASQQLTASAEQQASATNQVADAITDVASGAEKQSSAVAEAAMTIEQVSASIQEVSAASLEVSEKSGSTSQAAQDGLESIDLAVDQMDKIESITRDAQQAVDELALSSHKIGEITTLISGIAAQTNLLALNAGIEAARAGEHGKGFAVVATEVRKLAEQSSKAADEISELIHNNQAHLDGVVGAIQANVENVQTGIDVVKKAGSTFAGISDAITQIVDQVQEVSLTLERMAEDSQHMLSSMHQIESISKDNLDQSQMVSAATEEQAASVQQIAASSQNLASMAQELHASVSKFRV